MQKGSRFPNYFKNNPAAAAAQQQPTHGGLIQGKAKIPEMSAVG